MTHSLRKTIGVLLPLAVALATAAPALAYDTGPHAEITRDAMTAEGFGSDAIRVTQVNNWFVDFYEHPDKVPFSGHSGFWYRLAATAIKAENWSDGVIEAAQRTHFDSSTSTLFNTVGVTNEWNRLRRAVWTLAREARAKNDPEQLLAVLGISLHQLQDFYAHTNWIEPSSGLSVQGPGWRLRGYGSSPTWFDIPPTVRDGVTIFTAATQGHQDRQHGDWNSDGNLNMTHMNKDWPGRPMYMESAIAAYFASRQWVEAVRSWVGDDTFWARAQRYAKHLRDLRHDQDGMYGISQYSGHWQGQGEPPGAGAPGPGGSLVSLRAAIRSYFQWPFGIPALRGRTFFRRRFETFIQRVAAVNPPGELGPVPSSQDLQRALRIVVLRVLHMRGIHLGDVAFDDADLFASARINGQPLTSAVIHDHDRFSFPDPSEPFTWFKAVPAVPNRGEPVESIEVEVRTGDVRFAGTDDDVFLRLGRGLRFPLDKRLYDDFERGDRDVYSVPIDSAVRDGMRVGDIRRVQIEKSRDGIFGGWRLGGVRLRVNGRMIYSNRHVDRWLQDGDRTWTADDFVRQAPRGAKIPVWLRLDEDDSLAGGDDQGDINPFDRRRTVAVGYAPGPPLERDTIGGGRLGGRLDDGGEAAVKFRLETITPEPISVPPPPPPPPDRADLVITHFSITGLTVKNIGVAAAGPFRVRAGDSVNQVFRFFNGLAAGASATQEIAGLTCGGTYLATADDLEQVVESNEANNEKPSEPVIC